MSGINKLKIINDPIYGFITIPNELIYDLIAHPYFQRLRRISQMGLSYLVYPGAHHTRFHHALGCMHLMQKAIQTLQFKGVQLSNQEEEALYVAILLHDIGHGPFSHAMEQSIVENVHHEFVSTLFMEELNRVFEGKLTLAIKIFKGEYHRPFLNQLIAGQLDMDRMDYLKRDSFYSGVAEGNINSDRLIQMLHVVDEQLVVEEKGIHSVEKFLMARRLMYWQTYLHKTSVAAEDIITKVLKRAKELTKKGEVLPASTALTFFLNHKITPIDFTTDILNEFSKLDDYDILQALKTWVNVEDRVLSALCQMIINRDLPKIIWQKEAMTTVNLTEIQQKWAANMQLTHDEVSYFVFQGEVSHKSYEKKKSPILLMDKNKTVKPISEHSELINSRFFSKRTTKCYLCVPKKRCENFV